jgi:hypothetical protein
MKKSTIIALLVFMGLLVAVILSMGDKQEKGITRISFASLDTSKIDRISVSGKNPVELKLEGERWVLSDGRDAEPNAVKRLLEAISKINSSNLVTKDAARYADLEVDGEEGSRVVAYAGTKPLAEFTVGEGAPGGAHVRVKEAVYQVKQLYPYVFSRAAPGWYKLKLFDTKLEEVTRIEVSPASGKQFALVKKEEKWELADPKVAGPGFRYDKNSGRSLASAVVNVRAKEIVKEDPGKEKTGLAKGFDVLAFVDKTGQSHELHLGKAMENGDVYLQVAGQDDIYLVNKYTHKNLSKRIADLRDMKMIELDIEKVSALEIKDSGKQLVLEKLGTGWQIKKSSDKVPEKFEFDPSMVQRRLRSLANARGAMLSSEKADAKTGMKKPEATVKATMEDGKTVTLTFGKQIKMEKRDYVYAQGNADSEVYLANKATRTSLTGMVTTFKKRPPPTGGGMPNLDPQALSKLPPEVRAGLMKQMQQKQQQQKMLERIQKQMEAKKKAAPKKP